MAARPKTLNTAALKALRQSRGMSQHAFWAKVGVTQSGGSRYEKGRRLPKSVALLVDLVHVRGIDSTKVKREDLAIVQFMQKSHPDLYATLLKGVRGALVP